MKMTDLVAKGIWIELAIEAVERLKDEDALKDKNGAKFRVFWQQANTVEKGGKSFSTNEIVSAKCVPELKPGQRYNCRITLVTIDRETYVSILEIESLKSSSQTK